MANTIITKNSSTASAVPTSGDLVQGELAVNVTDKRLFTENASGTIVELGTNPSELNIQSSTGGVLTLKSTNTNIDTNGVLGQINFYNSDPTSNSPNNAVIIKATGQSGGGNGDLNFYVKSSGVEGGDPLLTMRLDDTGDISFYEETGTTAKFFWDASAERLEIGGNAQTGGRLYLESGTVTSFIRMHCTAGTGGVHTIQGSGTNGLGLEINADQTLTLNTNGSERFRITSDGNVGIGTDSPANYRLHVEGVDNTGAVYIHGGTGTSWGLEIGSHTSGSESDLVFTDNAVVGSQNSLSFVAESTGYFAWRTGGTSHKTGTAGSTERVRIDSAGNVGIGTVTPTDTLDVAGGITISAADGLDVTGSDSTASQTPLVFYRGGVGDKTGTACRIRTVGDGANNAVTMIFDTADTERMRIDSAGNVGINTAAPATMLELSASNNALAGSPPNNILRFNDTDTTVAADQPTGRIEFYVNDAGAGGTGVGSYIEGRAAGTSGGGYLAFAASGSTATGAAEQMRITQAGNVGIGTSSPAQKLHIDGNLLFENNNEIRFKDSGATQRTAIAMSSNDLNIGTSAGGNLKFYNGSSYTERARIDSSGNLLVGTTSSFGSGVGFCGFANGNAALRLKRGADYGATARFYNFGGSEVGSITVNASSTSYVTSSDYRLKEDWVAVADASTRVNALKPVNFAWKVDGSRVDGFLAHELAEVVPEAVTGEKDAVDADGNPKYQGIDQSKLVPLLTAALQEALVKIESLTARVSALEGN